MAVICSVIGSLCVGAATWWWHWPVVFCYAGPEYPDHDDREEREERLKQATINFAIRGGAEMCADHVLEDLANGEKKSCCAEIHYGWSASVIKQ